MCSISISVHVSVSVWSSFGPVVCFYVYLLSFRSSFALSLSHHANHLRFSLHHSPYPPTLLTLPRLISPPHRPQFFITTSPAPLVRRQTRRLRPGRGRGEHGDREADTELFERSYLEETESGCEGCEVWGYVRNAGWVGVGGGKKYLAPCAALHLSVSACSPILFVLCVRGLCT